MSFLDKRLTKFQSLIDKYAPISKPVILLLDNINMYHGNRSHHRLFKVLGPKMWNFTVRGLFIPDLTSIEHLFKQEETAQQAQCSSKITAWDTFIGKQQLSYSFTAFTGVLISVSIDFILNTFSHNLMVKLSE